MGKVTQFFGSLFAPRITEAEADRNLRVQTEQIERKYEKEIAALRSHLPDAAVESLLHTPDSAIDNDSHLYRSVRVGSGAKESTRDFTETQRQKMLRLSHLVYGLRGDGSNIVDLHLDFIIGDPLVPYADKDSNKTLQRLLDKIWNDERNRLDVRHERMTLSLLLEGELFISADMSATDGHLELGFLPPEDVKQVVQDERGRDAFVSRTREYEGDTRTELWFVLDSLTEDIEIERVPEDDDGNRYVITETTVDKNGVAAQVTKRVRGLCFAWFINRPEGATRGRGELVPVLDYIDIHDELLWATAAREKLLRFFLIHVVAKDVRTAADAQRKLKELGLLAPLEKPRVACTNDQVEVKIASPNSNGSPSKDLLSALAVEIYGAKGFPETWRGAAGSANLASARAMDVVPQRRLRRKQRQVLAYWERLIQVSIELRKRAGAATVSDTSFAMKTIEVGGKDKQRGAEILRTTATALAQAIASESVKVEAVNEILLQAADEAGFHVSLDNRGVPEDAGKDVADEMFRMAAQGASQFTRQDGEGNEDEDDRERSAERMRAVQ